MRLIAIIAAFTVMAVIGGCTHSVSVRRTYSATIERIVERQGEFYSPEKGHKPLTCLYLQVVDSENKGRGEILRVLVLDLYAPETYGEVGDRVLFGYFGEFPRSGEVDFDSLAGYKLLTKKS